uniref:Uncharacterized protein n=1 Tax=Leviviridae sp. TaxID=2027243 RepID=A0A514DA89_9VIRU|nr:MAG: hypothetical protein H2Bulk361266_000002 [Leviviridae sp.]
MSYSDPQTVTISGVAISLPRVSVGKDTSSYLSADGLVRMTAASTYGKRNRRSLRIDHSKISADPFIPATNVKQSMSCYIVFDTPVVGYTAAEALAVYAGFKGQFTAASDALITKLLGGES